MSFMQSSREKSTSFSMPNAEAYKNEANDDVRYEEGSSLMSSSLGTSIVVSTTGGGRL